MSPSRVSVFAAELKRRKVYRVASVYVVAGLGVLGAAEVILDPLGLGAVRPAIVILTLLGLPVALLLAWVYEVRAEEPGAIGMAEVGDASHGPGGAGKGSEGAPARLTEEVHREQVSHTEGAGQPLEPTRRLAAIMFADMVGYSALMQANERRAKENRDRTRRVLQAEVKAHRGQIVQYYGDGALSIFSSAIEAVEGAIAIQKELTGEPPVPLRIGIHTGDVVHDNEGAFGDGVNVASRIEALSVPGGVLVSGKVYDEIKNQPAIETRFLGDFNLKNISRPTPVYAIANEGLTVPDVGAMPLRAGGDVSSVAVLPFVNMSADPDNEYFSDGVSEELINLLTRINGLKVTARTSSFSFKGKNIDVRKIGRELGVRHILEGSVRRSGDRVRITAQLLATKDGYHLFSETYDRTIDDVFETQDEISRTIVAALEDKLAEDRHEDQGPDRSAMSAEAHKEYLKGRFQWAKWTPDGARAAIAHYERACALDPAAAQPHSGLAISYGYLGFLGQLPASKSYPEARSHAEIALELDATLGEAHMAFAMALLLGDWDFQGAYPHFQKALSLNPGSAEVHLLYAIHLIAAGDVNGAVEEMETAAALDPLSLMILQFLGMTYSAAGRFGESAEVLDRVLERDPHFRPAMETRGWILALQGDLEQAEKQFDALHRELADPLKGVATLGYVYGKTGRREEALRMLDRLEQRRERDVGVSLGMDFAMVHAGLEDYERAIDYLYEAKEERMAAVLMLPAWPIWSDLMDHPRMIEMFRDIGRPVEGGKPRTP